jgi:FKBP-type peptidyl-prolyl cis-trans isomerase
LTDDTEFDNSYDKGKPFEFVYGDKSVIPGWEKGLKSMKVGGKRLITIPSSLGYGAQGAPGGLIPPNATLKFMVELLAVY